MSVIQTVIVEEYERNQRMQKAYQEELLNFPRGSINKKRIKGHDYFYWVYRENGKVINKYISPKENDIEFLREQIKKRQHIQQVIGKLKIEQKEMQKYIRGIK